MFSLWRTAIRPWLYPVATVAVLIALAVRWLAGDLLEGLTYITFYPAVCFVTLLGGWRVGAYAVALSAVLAWWLLLPPVMSFAVQGDIVAPLIAFPLVAGLVVWMTALYEREAERYRLAAQRAELLFRELRHRVGNILQLSSSLLRVRAQALGPEHRAVITDAAAQLVAMQRIHDRIAGAGETVDLEPALRELCDTVAKLSPGLRCELRCNGVALPRDHLIPVALIVHELLNNAVEHGQNGQGSAVAVEVAADGPGAWRLSVTDDGPGLPDGFSIDGSPRQGLKIVQALAAQAHASFALRNRPDGRGTLAELSSGRGAPPP